jgi:uncharacterized BrkB/YihY/UPF0761 family membrane protein
METKEQNQAQYQNPQVPAQPYPNQLEDTAPLSIGSYLIMMIVTAIPLVGLIMLFVWGFSNRNVNRRNYARAALIIAAISIVLSIIFGASLVAWFASTLGSTGY